MEFGGFGFKPPFLLTDSAGLFGLWLRAAFVLAGEGVAVPFLDARLAVWAEANFWNAVAPTWSWFGCVELPGAEGLAGELLRGAKRLCFARAELAWSAAFRVEGLGPTRRCAVGPSAWPEWPTTGRRPG
jgi:hypothetical protein